MDCANSHASNSAIKQRSSKLRGYTSVHLPYKWLFIFPYVPGLMCRAPALRLRPLFRCLPESSLGLLGKTDHTIMSSCWDEETINPLR